MSIRVGRVTGSPSNPRLKGRKTVRSPANLVVIFTSLGSTAKCTNARRDKVTFAGSRSCRY